MINEDDIQLQIQQLMYI